MLKNMNRKILLFGILVFIVLLVGCTKNVYYTPPTDYALPVESQSPASKTDLPLLSPAEERAVIEMWGGLDFKYPEGWDASGRRTYPTEQEMEQFLEESYDDTMKSLHDGWKVNVLKIYRGELIFRGHGYNYLFIPEILNKGYDEMSSESRSKISNILRSEGQLNEFERDIINKHNAYWVCIIPGDRDGCNGDGKVIAFDNLEDIESFLDWWSTL